MPRTYCPECDAVIAMDNPRDGAQLRCPECGVELEVISTDPFEVFFPYDEEWDGDWDEDYEPSVV